MRPTACALAFIVFLLPHAALAQSSEPTDRPECAVLPANIQVSPLLAAAVELSLSQSETLRRQCGAIAGTDSVRVVIVPPRTPLIGCRARATIGRHAFGALRAIIELPMPALDVELLAHELEHVLEQIEGVDLSALARAGAPGVREVTEGVFETERARASGRRAAREVQYARERTKAREAPGKLAAARLGQLAADPQSAP